MVDYIYDGSFEGLLTAIFEVYLLGHKPNQIVSEDNYIENFLCEKIKIITNSQKAERVYTGIIKKISPDALNNVMSVFLSELPDSGMLIYNYLDLGWKLGSKLNLALSEDAVLNVIKVSQKVFGESHLMCGLVRFKHIKGDIYYSSIKPQFNILPLIAPHFSQRFANQNWIIHDVGRDLGILYNKQAWIISEINEDINKSLFIELEDDELDYEILWKNYFDNIAIKTKINPKLQKRNMPKRYWEFLIEKQNKIS